MYDSTKTVLRESDKSPSNDLSPRDPKGSASRDTDVLFRKKIHKIIGDGAGKSSVVRETVGYDFSGNLAVVVHQKDVEVNFGNGLRKRYKIRVPVSK